MQVVSSTPAIPLSKQEQQVLSYLQGKEKVNWEELVQFTKDPATVKLKSIRRIVSNIRKKYKEANQATPFICTFSSLFSAEKEEPVKPSSQSTQETQNTVEFNGQILVKLEKRNPVKPLPLYPPPIVAQIAPRPDFELRPFNRQVFTRTGLYNLGEDEFQIFEYFLNHRGRQVSLEELKNQVCYPKFGSKTPARWFFAIMRRINMLRKQIPEVREKLISTRMGNTTGYLLQG